MSLNLKLIEAIRKNELINFLEGKGEYKIELHQWVSADVPTDISKMMSEAVYKAFKDRPEIHIEKLLEDALLEMMDGEIFDLYISLMVIFDQLQGEAFNIAPFKIDRIKILASLKKSLKKNEHKMKNYFEWQGKNKKNGIWSEVLRIDSICKEDWNFSILAD